MARQSSGSFFGPLPGWLDALAGFGARGDGVADDAPALQRALDALGSAGCATSTLYLPAGTYRLTKTLTLPRRGEREAIGLRLVGEDPERTILRWDGPTGAAMLNWGAWYAVIGRLTFDGAGRADVALQHGPEFVTANEISDCVFRDVGVGIEGGDMRRAGIAEVSILRCRFVRCTQAGASLKNFNSLDWWFWRCLFEDCRIGVINALDGARKQGARRCGRGDAVDARGASGLPWHRRVRRSGLRQGALRPRRQRPVHSRRRCNAHRRSRASGPSFPADDARPDPTPAG